MKSIILFTRMGLCNRLFSMANWEVIAKLSDRKLYVVWTMDNDICRTEFSTIFTKSFLLDLQMNTMVKLDKFVFWIEFTKFIKFASGSPSQ